MKLKTGVGIALFLAIFLAGTILLLGLVKSYFIPSYFFFVLFMLIMGVYSMRESFEGRKEMIFAFFLILFIALFATYFADGAMIYIEKNKEFLNNNRVLVGQIDNLTKINDGYANSIDDLKDRVRDDQVNSLVLQTELDYLIVIRNFSQQTIIVTNTRTISSSNTQTTPPTPTPTPTPTPPPSDDDYEEEDD